MRSVTGQSVLADDVESLELDAAPLDSLDLLDVSEDELVPASAEPLVSAELVVSASVPAFDVDDPLDAEPCVESEDSEEPSVDDDAGAVAELEG